MNLLLLTSTNKVLEAKIVSIGEMITRVGVRTTEPRLRIPKKERRLSLYGEERTPKTLEKQLKNSADKRSQFKRTSYALKVKSHSQAQESDLRFSSRLIEVSKFQ